MVAVGVAVGVVVGVAVGVAVAVAVAVVVMVRAMVKVMVRVMVTVTVRVRVTDRVREVHMKIGDNVRFHTTEGERQGKLCHVNPKTVWVRLDGGKPIKRHIKKHGVKEA